MISLLDTIKLLLDTNLKYNQDAVNKILNCLENNIAELDNETLVFILMLYQTGYKNFNSNNTKYMSFLQKAADVGNIDAICNLGNVYRYGKRVPKNIHKAIELFKKAADLGNTYAMNKLGYIYNNNNEVKKNIEKATEYFKKAADLDDIEGINNLAYMYINYDKDKKKGIELFTKAANLGNIDAMINLCYMYIEGKGVEKNIDKAKEYLKKAEDLSLLNPIRNKKRKLEENICDESKKHKK